MLLLNKSVKDDVVEYYFRVKELSLLHKTQMLTAMKSKVLFYTYPFVIAVGAVECRMATSGNELYPPYL